MSENKVALAIIAKDKSLIIERMLNSTKGIFDFYALQDTGSSDNTVEIFEEWCKSHDKEFKTSKKVVGNDYLLVNVDGKEILGDFASARNDSFKLIPDEYKWAFWMDTDDVLYNPQAIPTLVELANKSNLDAVLLQYEYAKMGNINMIEHPRERLINLKKKGEWKNRVHENYRFLEQPVLALGKELGVDIKIIHERTGEESQATNRRNHLIMKGEVEEKGLENVDDELVSHMAFDHWEHKELEQSIALYLELEKRQIAKNYPIQDLFNTFLRLANCYFLSNNLGEALNYALKAKKINNKNSEVYILLSEIYLLTEQPQEAVLNADRVLQLGKTQTISPTSDLDYLIKPRSIKLTVAMQMKNFQLALQLIEELIQLMPGNVQWIENRFELQRELRKSLTIKAIGEISLYYQENNMSDQLDKVIDIIPLELKEDTTIRAKIKELKHDLKVKTARYKFDGAKSIVFFAGPHYEPWDGETDNKGGIGGSEGMCIQMARELAELGNKVYVYNECGYEEKEIDGVIYRHHSLWNERMECDIFVALRIPQIFGKLIKAKKQYLWLHDTNYGDQSLVNMYAPNNIFVLTECHKDIIKTNHGIKDESVFWLTRNALNKKALEYVDNNPVERKHNQVIWTSSYDRGLDFALDAWEKVKREVPDAEFKIVYGWNGYDKMMQARGQQNPAFAQQMAAYKSSIIDKISKIGGVQELGRVSQNEVYKMCAESAVWFYPTAFQEISCISAMTAQAMGAFPVCTPYAALKETVSSKYGMKVNRDKIADALIYQLKNQDEQKRKEMIEWARSEYDIRSLAKEWDLKFNQA